MPYQESERAKEARRSAENEDRLPMDIDNPDFYEPYSKKFDELYDECEKNDPDYFTNDKNQKKAIWVRNSARLHAWVKLCSCKHCKDSIQCKVFTLYDFLQLRKSFKKVDEEEVNLCDFLRALMYGETMEFPDNIE